MRGARAVLAGVLAGAVVGTVLVRQPVTHAQPAGSGSVETDRAKELYVSARKALDEKRYADAIRDFGAVFDITKDPVMFYWIASANDRAGKCDIALIYYGRYLKEGRPNDQFQTTVQARISACGGDPRNVGTPTPGSGSAPAPIPEPPPTTGSGSAEPIATGSGSGEGSAPPPPPKAKHQGPWIMVGGAIALATIGAVLAYSADAAERDIEDLYVGLEGTPPVFDARTKKRYDDLIAEGERYEKLSWVSFALAGGLGIGAAVWFYLSRDTSEQIDKSAVIVPTVSEDGVGAAATIRW